MTNLVGECELLAEYGIATFDVVNVASVAFSWVEVPCHFVIGDFKGFGVDLGADSQGEISAPIWVGTVDDDLKYNSVRIA